MKYNLLFLICLLLTCCKQTQKKEKLSKKIVIAHRGASAYLPEHTLEAKAMAFAMNVNFIEQDLVLSKDDVPIVIHDIYLDDVTDVATKFPNRKRKDNRFYVIDFTYQELKTLQVTERFNPKTGKQFYPDRFPKWKGSFKLHSLQEEIELIQGLNASTGKKIGIYPEIKEPKFHQKEGKNLTSVVLKVLDDYGYKTKNDNCILQCFDANELERIRVELKSELFLVQLIEHKEEAKQLKHFATYADGIGPWYKQILLEKVEGKFTFTNLVKEAHELELKVHPYTFRADALAEFSSFNEMLETLLIDANVDGAFTDFPDKVVHFLKNRNQLKE
ncbi:glycerophosphodiester phosphodiesterase [Polaribacter dokdonensis]|uniref:glycerophosphodiester phosphodiesterase n=1 Tax=Polaribacter dokdonensis DSW-5 TaxID=1300348 RepID=A0A0N0UNM1_9FLAO|nr:glycerophosphodiester phosphodiesterase [Polaribacter dokdonensis]KOY51837.1 Glycerophosphoryl diester phosphodiesterase family protein [Polaribacter dokdonensis DSW-5]SEE01840.1 glycerophosphoryl diester phosphodiesterase [Polaribacter dokdonensis DSW-5]